ncbi:unnamed protein product [Rhizophagus irregularis]|nr:unnamed protein product [Rhizophagus irregularis]
MIQGNGKIDDTKSIMEEFVTQFDIAQNIVNLINKLTQLGHFGYRKYNESTKGTNRLGQISEKLKKELEFWGKCCKTRRKKIVII